MIPDPDSLISLALDALQHAPTPGQADVLAAFAEFACHRRSRDVLIVNGYAGTGKTSVLGAMVSALKSLGAKPVVLAPTGRAAKVAAGFSPVTPFTIHKYIYRLSPGSDASRNFVLGRNTLADTIFFVDEASMITDKDAERSLLSDLISYVYSSVGCGIIFVGDTAQLPPVGRDDSPAMQPEHLRKLGLAPKLVELKEPVRQALDSGILHNATIIRNHLFSHGMPRLELQGMPDVRTIESTDLADFLTSSWSRVGSEETLLVTRSNGRANRFNSEIRGRILGAEGPLMRGERLIISKNNYFVTRGAEKMPFLANGEIITVEWVGSYEKMYGRYFIDIDFRLQGEETLRSGKLMIRSLAAEGAQIPRQEMENLATHIMKITPGELSQKMKAVDNDPYYNALQAKYAYCLTCHKAQGGQWADVYVDMSGISPESMDLTFHRWLYTAVTRAKERLYFVNLPEEG